MTINNGAFHLTGYQSIPKMASIADREYAYLFCSIVGTDFHLALFCWDITAE